MPKRGVCSNTNHTKNNNNNNNNHDPSIPATATGLAVSHHPQYHPQRSTTNNEWQVILFRRTVSRGWEVYFPNGTDNATTNPTEGVAATASTNKKKGGKNTHTNSSSHPKQKQQQQQQQQQLNQYIHQQLITVTPKQGCIEMKQLRLRIPLSSKPLPNSTGTSSSSTVPAVTVTRRMDTILLTTTRGGCIVFKFTSLEACVAFWDELVLLNTSTTDTDGRQLEQQKQGGEEEEEEEHYENPRKQLLDLASRKSQRYDKGATTHSTKYASDYKCEEFRSMLIRLLHEEDFMDFVNELDECLTSNADGATMLQNAASALII